MRSTGQFAGRQGRALASISCCLAWAFGIEQHRLGPAFGAFTSAPAAASERSTAAALLALGAHLHSIAC